jgi:hypothetical protein
MGLRTNHPALSLAAQDNVPLPVLETANICATGLAPPAVPEKTRLGGLTLKLDVEIGGLTVNDTGRTVLRVLPFGPTSVMITFEEWFPAGKLDRLTSTLT